MGWLVTSRTGKLYVRCLIPVSLSGTAAIGPSRHFDSAPFVAPKSLAAAMLSQFGRSSVGNGRVWKPWHPSQNCDFAVFPLRIVLLIATSSGVIVILQLGLRWIPMYSLRLYSIWLQVPRCAVYFKGNSGARAQRCALNIHHIAFEPAPNLHIGRIRRTN